MTLAPKTIYNLTDLAAVKFLYYNGVPKSGSTTTRNVVKKLATKLGYKYTLRKKVHQFYLTNFHYDSATTSTIISSTEELQQKTPKSNRLLFQHIHFINFTQFDEDLTTPFYLNLIRDPVEHYISWYYYRRTSKLLPSVLGPLKWFDYKAYNKQPKKYKDVHFTECSDCARYFSSSDWLKTQDMTFEQCVLSDNEECRDASYTFRMIPFFCGMEDFCVKPCQASLNKAKQNVNRYFPVVGYLENMQGFLELCEKVWPQFFRGATKVYKLNSATSHKKNTGNTGSVEIYTVYYKRS